jgi:acid phosphatase type 7
VGPSRSCPAHRHHPASAALLALALLAGCAHYGASGGPPATFRVEAPARAPLNFIAYGDMRFTAATERVASAPGARQALVARIAAEAPAAVFLTGDIPWHGGTVADYQVYREETAAWRERGLAVYPALGNHEFAQCAEAECLENWWNAFPALRGRRWYSIAVGQHVLAVALDSDASLEPGGTQRAWLEAQLGSLPRAVDFVFVYLHHPPAADPQVGVRADHNPRPNELALAAYLRGIAARSRARFIVCAGHIHNYERREQGGIVYLVSGGGGARAIEVDRDAGDLYRGPGFPNFHYLRFTLDGDVLRGEMLRLEDFDAALPASFVRRDAFELRAAPR